MDQAIDRELVFEVTVPALQTKAAPLKEPTSFAPGTVANVEVVIPAGAAGLAGIRISSNGTQVFPINTGAWLIGDNEVIQKDVYNFPNSGRLEVEGFNEDINAHTFVIRYAVAENPLPLPEPEKTSSPLALGPTGQPLPPEPPSETGLPTPAEPPSGTEPPSPPPLEPPPPIEPPPVSPEPPPEAIEHPPTGEPPSEVLPEGAPEPPPIEETPPPELAAPEGPPIPSSEEGESGGYQGTGGVRAPAARGAKRKRARAGRKRTVVVRESRPAGGWLPHGARFTLERTDQGQDFITAWKGRIVAPASGHVVHVLHDKPYPSGFGRAYAVVHIDSGPFGGKDWYIGHCTAAVKQGQRFGSGAVLAHADQGHASGGGWVELGEAPGGYPGKMGAGAHIASLFKTVTVTHKHRVAAGPPKRKKPGKGHKPSKGTHGHPKRKRGVKAKVHKGKAPKRVRGAKKGRVAHAHVARVKRARPARVPRAPRAKRVRAPRAPRVKRAPAVHHAAAKRRRRHG